MPYSLHTFAAVHFSCARMLLELKRSEKRVVDERSLLTEKQQEKEWQRQKETI